MKLAILGGGGFRVPLVHDALLADESGPRVTEVTLYDVDRERLATIGAVVAEQALGHRGAPRVQLTTDLDDAVRGAAFVFSAIRVGGLAGRSVDERIALDEHIVGQETVGAGGIAFGLRTVPTAVELAKRIATLAPDAWVVNFTNPAGMVTEAMAAHLGERVIGVCDSPVGLGRRVAAALDLDPSAVWFDYAGLNHLGWLRGVHAGGRDHMPRLLADPARLATFEEGRLFGAEWLAALGAIPNEYLHYFYFAREVIEAARAVEQPRGAFLLAQQQRFYDAARTTGSSLDAWREARAEREATYMAESRRVASAGARDSCDVEAGGYEQVALQLMTAIAGGRPATLILNVANRGALGVLDEHAVVEVPCLVDGNGARPVVVSPLSDHAAGLVCGVKAAERATIEAALSGSRSAALRAFAIHPLVDSVPVARRLLDAYADRLPLAHLRG